MIFLKLIAYIFGKHNVLRLLNAMAYSLRKAESDLRACELGTNEEYYSIKYTQDVYESWLDLFDENPKKKRLNRKEICEIFSEYSRKTNPISERLKKERMVSQKSLNEPFTI